MTKKILLSIGITFMLLVAQFGSVLAAQEATPINGTIQSITLETDATTGQTTVLVTLVDATGATQTLSLSTETAASLGLVTTDPTTGVTTVNSTAIGTTANIDPTTIITDGTTGEEEAQHPVGSALADFFGELLGVDYQTIMDYHGDGTGFGVIAQALWMTKKLDGDTATFQAILDAKRSGDYSAVTLPDGSTPQNWGQFRKAVLGTANKDNLGTVMSGNGHGQGNNDLGPQNNKDKNKPDKDKHNNQNHPDHPNHP